MPSSFRDPKSLPEWIESDFHRRQRPLRRWRGRIGLGVFLLGLVTIAAAALSQQANFTYQAEPVSRPHLMFNHDCTKCHQGQFETAKRFFSFSPRVRSVPNKACIQCHDGHPHNAFLKDNESGQCATCHREHEGRAQLAQVNDHFCTECHNNLMEHHKRGSSSFQNNVAGFPEGHPEFKFWRTERKDPGQLLFNHQVHLSLLIKDFQDKNPEKKDDRDKLLNKSCAKCHQYDDAGAYVKPINYEKHCQECHPLSVQLVGEFQDAKLKDAVAKFNAQPAPHRAPKVVRGTLRERLLDFVLKHQVVPSTEKSSEREIPGPPRYREATDEQWTWAKRKLTEIERHLFVQKQLPVQERELFHRSAGCRYCHLEKTPLKEKQDPISLPEIIDPSLPSRWLSHSKFDHRKHRMLNCTECHPAEKSKLTADVLMPKMQSCKDCHNSTVGAPSDCVTCHTYHPKEMSGTKVP